MKVKEIDRTANVAWSPAAQHPIYLAAGTAAQQLDASFSTNASLEIYGLNLAEPGLDMSIKGSVNTDFRFHKIVWGPNSSSPDYSFSTIVGGADDGNLFMYDPMKLIKGDTAMICQRDKHTGPVTALDFNPFQLNLLASGASDSEIFIWDLNNPNNPMTPGAKSQPGEDVTCVAWNLQVQHILASTFAARCVVWDLRKNEPIIKVSDSTSRIRCKCVAWHPEIATQMCLASEDDHMPVIQLWDLRFATSPLKSLENHQRGVLSVAWCRRDPDLLLSCGKDNRILCWNPNSNVHGGEILAELPTSSQWSFEVAWCPRNPAMIASSSFDGHVSIYSMMGGQRQSQPSSKICESFPGTDPNSQAPQLDYRPESVTLKKPPKWLRTPVRACFGFGGKLISFENPKIVSSSQQPQVPPTERNLIYISQVVTEPTLVARSTQLETTIQAGQYNDFCHLKLTNFSSAQDEKLWQFVKANLDVNPRVSFLNLLGYDPQEVATKINAALAARPDSRSNLDDETGVDAEELAQRMTALGSTTNSSLRASPSAAVNNISASRTPDSALNFSGDGISAFDAIASGMSQSTSPGSGVFTIQTNDEIDGLISKALLTGNVEVAVDLCLRENRAADAIILAIAGGQDLLSKTKKKYFRQSKSHVTKLISSVVNQDWIQVVESCDVSCWKEALAACLTYAKPDELLPLCEMLGGRLEVEREGEFADKAMLCYICAGNVEKLADSWVKSVDDSKSPKALQDLVELTMVLKHAIELQGSRTEISSGPLILSLRSRLYKSIGQNLPGIQEPPLPFAKRDVKASLANGLPSNLGQQQQKSFNYPAKDHFAFSQQQIPSYQVLSSQNPIPFLPPSGSVPTFPPMATSMNTGPPLGGHVTPPVPPSPTMPPQRRPSFGVNPQLPIHEAPMAPPPSLAPTMTTQSKPLTKGHLSHRYPTMPQDPSIFASSQNNPMGQYGSAMNYSTSTVSDFSNYNTMNAMNTMNAPMTPYSNATIYNPAYAIPDSIQPPPLANAPSVPSSSMPNAPPAFFKPGWNDPPSLKNQPNPKTDYEPPAPITRPIYSAEPIPAPMDMYQPAQTTYYNPQQNVNAYPSMPPQQHQIQQHQMQQQQAPEPPVQAQPEPPKPKAPIPAENQILYDVYEDLKHRCEAAANNPQMKRKLDDVSRKLETLYDKLRENELSQSTVLGLHQLVQLIQQFNYQNALATHAHIVSTSAFSEISTFMPALKVLLQTAQQLAV
uniref:Protein transport protein Sec31A n=1 Tax=Strigamia maritima TaxID=126957 RepID=T1JFC4_STRMM